MKSIYTIIFIAFFTLGLILSASETKAVSVSANSLCSLPTVLTESSGVDFNGGTNFWSHNDAGGNAAIYQFADNGSLLRTVNISNAHNRDWEDLTHDAARNYMFIGDFGNNRLY